MSQSKIKVVWICHLSNDEIQSLLPLRKHIEEFAPWNPNFLKGFENEVNVEFHIISPHNYLIKPTKLFLRNINYYFIPFGIPIIHRHWPRFFRMDIFVNFYFFRKKVKKIVNSIKPDLINLIGAENSYYSSSILDFTHDYPVLILIQGFISEFKDQPHKSFELKNRIYIEEKILTTYKYFSGEQDSANYTSTYNSNYIFYKVYFPVNELLVSKTIDKGKRYDCIYFGRLEKSKGCEDFIKVISEIKKQKLDVKGCIIGSGDLNPLKSLAKQLNCYDNIEFVGFVNSQTELFEYVKASKVFLAPPYNERLSSTIREAMLLRVPIVAYATGGIPYINEFDEHIYLVKTGNYKEMAKRTIQLLLNENLALKLTDKAYNFAINEFSLKVNMERLLKAYYSILNYTDKDKYGL